jgi:hypothetical protein
MHDTADKLEVAEAILHRSAERSPDTGTTDRLHALGDQVTARARDIDRRADRLTAAPPQTPRSGPATGNPPAAEADAEADGDQIGAARDR